MYLWSRFGVLIIAAIADEHYEPSHRLPLRSLIIRSLCIALAVAPGVARAQPGPITTSDAALIPSGSFRVRLLTQWTRYDGLFGVPGVPANVDVPQGFRLNVDSLGVSQIPSLGTAQSEIRSASGLPQFSLNLGKLTTAADTRIVSSPLIVEYGITKRWMIGVMASLVQSRTTVVSQLNNRLDPLAYNVGPNPARFSPGIGSNNGIAVTDLRNAAIQLGNLLTSCASNPAQSRCQTVNGRQAQAQALIQASNGFAGTVESLYGTAAVRGQPFVPLASGAAQHSIDTTFTSLGAQLGTYLGSANPVASDSIEGAAAPAAIEQFQNLLTDSTIGRDTLGTSTRFGFGDVEIRTAVQLFDTFGDTSDAADRGVHARVTATGAFRFGSGAPGSHNRFFDPGTGYGQPGVEVGAMGDFQLRSRLSATVGASYTAQLGTIGVQRPANTANAPFPITAPVPSTYSAGNVLDLLILPRIRLTRVFFLEGTYLMRRTGADRYTIADSARAVLAADAPLAGFESPTYPFGASASTEQDVGFGFSYSTIAAGDANAGRLLAEFSFRHLEAVKGGGGPIPKSSRDQLELRIYPRLR